MVPKLRLKGYPRPTLSGGESQTPTWGATSRQYMYCLHNNHDTNGYCINGDPGWAPHRANMRTAFKITMIQLTMEHRQAPDGSHFKGIHIPLTWLPRYLWLLHVHRPFEGATLKEYIYWSYENYDVFSYRMFMQLNWSAIASCRNMWTPPLCLG